MSSEGLGVGATEVAVLFPLLHFRVVAALRLTECLMSACCAAAAAALGTISTTENVCL